MSLVTIKGATKRKRKPRSLTVAQFHEFVSHLEEPFRTMALLCVCFGLRISEALGLKWRDVDWLNRCLKVERSIVCQIVDDVKTPESEQNSRITPEILSVLKVWKQATQFSANEDWIFASPVQIGRLPWAYDQVWSVYQKAAKKAGLGGLGTHRLRHTIAVGWMQWEPDRSSAKVDASRRYPNHDELVRRCGHGRNATSHAKVIGLALWKAN